MQISVPTVSRLALLIGIIFGLSSNSEASVVVIGDNSVATGHYAGFGLPSGDSLRYQQVYGASAFSSLSGPFYITQLAFTASSGPAYTISNIQIDLSTTSSHVDALNVTFANNVGSDDVTVFSGSLSYSGTFSLFNFVVNLTTPFLYDPSVGNLLLDIRNFSGASITASNGFAADESNSDLLSRIYSAEGTVSATQAANQDSVGMVTQFTVTPAHVSPVPEPATSLFGMAIISVVGFARRRRSDVFVA